MPGVAVSPTGNAQSRNPDDIFNRVLGSGAPAKRASNMGGGQVGL
jgi:hypothetical protein